MSIRQHLYYTAIDRNQFITSKQIEHLAIMSIHYSEKKQHCIKYVAWN